MKRSTIWILATVLVTLSPSFARAKDAARKIPVYAWVIGSTVSGTFRYTYVGPSDMSLIAREVEFANRAYGDANIRFTFAGRPDTEYVVWDDLNCWSDKETNPSDVENAEWLASFMPDMLSSIFTSFRTEIDGTECVPTHCTGTPGVCTACNGNNCSGTDVGCWTYPWDPVPYCFSNVNWCNGPNCFKTTPTFCTPKPACGFDNTQLVFSACMFNVKDPAGEGLGTLAHEFGHHFGLAHTFNVWESRCYDYGKLDKQPAECGAEPEPSCNGNSGSCTGVTYVPWKNMMSYHGRCDQRHGGTYHGPSSDWNSTFTHDQIYIIWRTLNEYYDKQLASATDDPVIQYGSSEPIYVTQDQPLYPGYPTAAAMGYDRFDQMWFGQTGNAQWTRSNVSLVQGDFNADGYPDAIVTVNGGAQPGTSFFAGLDTQGRLTFVRQLMAGTTPNNSQVLVGNFRGDRSDDVLIRTSGGTWEYEGLARTLQVPLGGPQSTASASHSGWGTSSTTIVLGDFGGDFTVPVPLPSYLASASSSTSNQSYLDAIVLYSGSGGAFLYPGTPTGLLQSGSQYLGDSTTYPMSSKVWAADVWGDHHHEFLVKGPNGFEVFKGTTTAFSLSSGNRLSWITPSNIPTGASVNLAIGDFSADYKADYVMSASGTTGYNGSKLYSGAWNSPPGWSSGDWYRPDLTPGAVQYVVGDLTRGAYDDLMLITSLGSFLYAGQPPQAGARTLAENVWTDWTSQFSSSQARWSGR
jgi:hypothetical protein